jgi:hypothetical protein
LNQIFNFQQPKNYSYFYFFFSFLFWPTSISSSIFLVHLILSVIFFLPTQSAIRLSRAFSPATQFPLVIFDLQMPATAFGLSGRCTALCCVVRLRYCGAASPPPPFLHQKWLHTIAFPSLFSSPVTDVIQVLSPLPPSP